MTSEEAVALARRGLFCFVQGSGTAVARWSGMAAKRKTARKTRSSTTSRCWPGWEPVPGKRAHEQGSCRKKPASRSTSSEKKVQAARKRQLSRWQAKHPRARRSAAQHLGRPGARRRPGRKRARASS